MRFLYPSTPDPAVGGVRPVPEMPQPIFPIVPMSSAVLHFSSINFFIHYIFFVYNFQFVPFWSNLTVFKALPSDPDSHYKFD